MPMALGVQGYSPVNVMPASHRREGGGYHGVGGSLQHTDAQGDSVFSIFIPRLEAGHFIDLSCVCVFSTEIVPLVAGDFAVLGCPVFKTLTYM